MKENKSLFTGLLVGAILAGALMFFFMQNKAAQSSARLHHYYEEQYALLIDSVRQSGLVNLMGPLLAKAEKELAQDSSRTLRDETIRQISALSEGFKPYAIFKNNHVSPEKLSPERGHLLLMLLGMNMNTASWQNVLASVTFENADLKGADLHDAQLSGINLSFSNFKEANLSGANLASANLRSTIFFGAVISGADLHKSDLTTADLSWANLKEADMSEAILNGALLSSANLRYANLKYAIAQRAILNDAFLDSASLDHIDLLEASLDRVHVRSSDFQSACLVLTTFREANLYQAELDSATVKNDDWFLKAKGWNVQEVDKLKRMYSVMKDTANQKTAYRLIRSME